MEDTWIVTLTFSCVISTRQINYSDVIVLCVGKHQYTIVTVLNLHVE